MSFHAMVMEAPHLLPTQSSRPDGTSDQEFKEGMGRYVVGFCFGMEHILLAFVAMVWMGIPSQPRWVRQKIMRIHYLREQGARQATLKKRE